MIDAIALVSILILLVSSSFFFYHAVTVDDTGESWKSFKMMFVCMVSYTAIGMTMSIIR